jgi:hypothetical protein
VALAFLSNAFMAAFLAGGAAKSFFLSSATFF